ncbi:hypothetical protein [Desulfuromonas sp. TF]|uniref:hypothetical protein n=1 Tax=Desulfuromonas sp. TF TaxID=1232410 RepID=UPI00041B6453|nr:hypothetical protein [Desulfuromonas sp. TF]
MIDWGKVKTDEEKIAEAREAEARAELRILDEKVPRGLEDLVGALKAKGILSDADLPAELGDHIARKAAARLKIPTSGV